MAATRRSNRVHENTPATPRGNQMDDIDAAEDWASIAPHGLESLERSLRCDICSELFDHPVTVVGCGHTFCAACVRDAIARSTDNLCPAQGCPVKNVTTAKLQSVRAIADAVTAWRGLRSELMATLKKADRATKRKATDQGVNGSAKRLKKGKESSEIVDASDEDDIVEVDRDPQLFPDSIVECPSCQKKMKYANLDGHLNRCGKSKQDLGALGKLGKPMTAPKAKRIPEGDLKTSEILSSLDSVYGLKIDAKESPAYIKAYWARWKAIWNGNLDVPPTERSTDSELREKMRASIKGIRAELAGTDASKAAIKADHAKTNASHFRDLIGEAKKGKASSAAPMSRSTSGASAPARAATEEVEDVGTDPIEPEALPQAPLLGDDDSFDVLAPLPSKKYPLLDLPPPEPFSTDFPRPSQRSPPRRDWA